jgi:hypothetical protein
MAPAILTPDKKTFSKTNAGRPGADLTGVPGYDARKDLLESIGKAHRKNRFI